jgi:hypothetical protein
MPEKGKASDYVGRVSNESVTRKVMTLPVYSVLYMSLFNDETCEILRWHNSRSIQ